MRFWLKKQKVLKDFAVFFLTILEFRQNYKKILVKCVDFDCSRFHSHDSCKGKGADGKQLHPAGMCHWEKMVIHTAKTKKPDAKIDKAAKNSHLLGGATQADNKMSGLGDLSTKTEREKAIKAAKEAEENEAKSAVEEVVEEIGECKPRSQRVITPYIARWPGESWGFYFDPSKDGKRTYHGPARFCKDTNPNSCKGIEASMRNAKDTVNPVKAKDGRCKFHHTTDQWPMKGDKLTLLEVGRNKKMESVLHQGKDEKGNHWMQSEIAGLKKHVGDDGTCGSFCSAENHDNLTWTSVPLVAGKTFVESLFSSFNVNGKKSPKDRSELVNQLQDFDGENTNGIFCLRMHFDRKQLLNGTEFAKALKIDQRAEDKANHFLSPPDDFVIPAYDHEHPDEGPVYMKNMESGSRAAFSLSYMIPQVFSMAANTKARFANFLERIQPVSGQSGLGKKMTDLKTDLDGIVKKKLKNDPIDPYCLDIDTGRTQVEWQDIDKVKTEIDDVVYELKSFIDDIEGTRFVAEGTIGGVERVLSRVSTVYEMPFKPPVANKTGLAKLSGEMGEFMGKKQQQRVGEM